MRARWTTVTLTAALLACAAVAADARKDLADWGIEVASLHLSAGGRMVDFRYRVLDPRKAAELGNPDAKVYLIDQASGAQLKVPNTPKVGPLRQTAEELVAGKVYFIIFSNAAGYVKRGSKVTVVIGDFAARDLVVE